MTLTDASLVGKEKPANCRMRLQAEGKPNPKSGCYVCHNGGLFGCPYDAQRDDHLKTAPPRQIDSILVLREAVRKAKDYFLAFENAARQEALPTATEMLAALNGALGSPQKMLAADAWRVGISLVDKGSDAIRYYTQEQGWDADYARRTVEIVVDFTTEKGKQE